MSNFTFLGCLEVVDLWLETKAKQQQHFHRFNGFLSLQLRLRLELGFGLRLTNTKQSLGFGLADSFNGKPPHWLMGVN
jgi:hypothetical protein